MSEENKDENNLKEMEKVLEDMTTQKYCKTNIIKDVNFTSEEDEYVFNRLPLSNSQKEQILLELYKI